MPTILIIEKTGSIVEKEIESNTSIFDLYKYAKLKTPANFVQQYEWDVQMGGRPFLINLFGKLKGGRAGQENKYELPPPMDTKLFFGRMLLVNMANGQGGQGVGSITKSEWKKIYEALYGGFEDLGSEDSESESESDDGVPLTSTGYKQDGFVVEDDDVPAKKPRSRASSVASVDTSMAKRMMTLFDRIDATQIRPHVSDTVPEPEDV